jgi:hypothetical protein
MILRNIVNVIILVIIILMIIRKIVHVIVTTMIIINVSTCQFSLAEDIDSKA